MAGSSTRVVREESRKSVEGWKGGRLEGELIWGGGGGRQKRRSEVMDIESDARVVQVSLGEF